MISARRMALVVAGVLVGSLMNLTGASAGTICNDGSYSYNSGRGTCSWHGGVNKAYPSYSDPGSSSWNRNNGLSSWNNRNSGLSSWNNRNSGLSSWNNRNSGLSSYKSSWKW
jgi:hypothetical protein